MPARDKQTATENVQVLMFYPVGKNLEKNSGGSGNPPPPPLYFRGLITTHNDFSCLNLNTLFAEYQVHIVK